MKITVEYDIEKDNITFAYTVGKLVEEMVGTEALRLKARNVVLEHKILDYSKLLCSTDYDIYFGIERHGAGKIFFENGQ